ncbi:hypothetical protein HYH02_005243 [Chlamydomonas schloesseri]|uniref:Poly A polymerase head domain-containing protein n=1 Tax=Chlamydomonas schloesseri TaxID=2026947 RepID=A0A835WML1_9CHLO|nr:hypothetical protein HYH02_005243 [Chlamydomonas schloesseri]|eukprot:KAG2449716.1 hypothetical protein HYH02_005243 [Chlamydomonas schloesseri]
MAVLSALQRSPCQLPRRLTPGPSAVSPATRAVATAQQPLASSASAEPGDRRARSCSAAAAAGNSVTTRSATGCISLAAVPAARLRPAFPGRLFTLSSRYLMSTNDSAAATGAAATAGAGAGVVDPMDVRDTIQLTDKEREIFDTLLAAVRQAGSGTTLRCAGGWVRDKLLGRGSDDIDIALDDCLGKDFAELVNEFLKSQGREARHAAVIHSNPDQSKHLETARMKIGEVWLDLVNLRSETYAADSRIPTMTFGTPQQDALRRDFTINALFYNISAGGVVEDLTGRGLQDLRDGLIRTPLPPMETFLDDPLRVLRAVRFGTRFGFQLHPDILEAAASEQVRAAAGGELGGGGAWGCHVH